MKLTVLVLLLAFLALSSASLQEIVNKSSQQKTVSILNPQLEDVVPELGNAVVSAPLTRIELRKQQDLRSSNIFGDNVNLEWRSWNGALPNGAVSIYNSYTSRTDYVCKYSCETGFYNPNLGSYCYYAYGNREVKSLWFEILVNKDDFEVLEWKYGSYGSVPEHSVRSCVAVDVFVGKNKYGLGKVVPRFKAFFLPWRGKEYWYKTYDVLTINRDAYTQHISDVKYALDDATISQDPPETIRTSSITNNKCQDVVKTVTITETTRVETTWSISRATTQGITSSITASIPLLGSVGIEMSSVKTVQFSRGTTMVEELSHSVSVELTVPPNHSCKVRMVGRKKKADIPYTARLSRTYSNGQTRSTTITGMYDGVQIGDIQAVVDRCEAVVDAKPCP